MLTTINTDASYHSDYKIGAFAFWSISDQFKITKAGYFKQECKNPHEAEMKCIINAIAVTLSANKNIRRIVFNTDSMNSIHVFTNDRANIRRYGLQWAAPLRRQFNKYLKNYDRGRNRLKIEFRHVKAHTGNDDKRSYVNEWCDTQAKYYLWKRINQLKANGKLN